MILKSVFFDFLYFGIQMFDILYFGIQMAHLKGKKRI
jgi:hypothetical protein